MKTHPHGFDPSLAQTDALMAVYLQRQAERPMAPTESLSVDTLAQHLQAAGQRQGWTISDEEARTCAQMVAGRTPNVPPAVTLAPARPTWSRPRSAAAAQRACHRIKRAAGWAKSGYDHSHTWADRLMHGTHGVLALGLGWVIQAHLHLSQGLGWFVGSMFSLILFLFISLIGEMLNLRRRVSRIIFNSCWRFQCHLQRRWKARQAWQISESELNTYATVPALAAQLKGVLQAKCPPLKLDQAALQAQHQALAERAQREALLLQMDQRLAQATPL